MTHTTTIGWAIRTFTISIHIMFPAKYLPKYYLFDPLCSLFAFLYILYPIILLAFDIDPFYLYVLCIYDTFICA